MAANFSQFIRERQYLHNVSPTTLEWYKHSFKWLCTENPCEQELKDAVIRMREKGLKATGCNSAIRAINAYLRWSSSPHRVLYLKEDQRVLPTFSLHDIKKLLTYRPKPTNRYQRRQHLLILLLLDCGCRIDEVLSLKAADCDLDNLLFTVTGKGRKQRKIPFSFELRRHLSRFLVDLHPEQLVFATRHGRKLGRRNVLRDVKRLCRHLGVARENTSCVPAHLRRPLSTKRRKRVPSPKSARAFNAGDDAAVCELAHGGFASDPSASIVVGCVAVTCRSSLPVVSLVMTVLILRRRGCSGAFTAASHTPLWLP